MQPVRLSFVFFTILNQNRRVVDFVRVGYFIPLNGQLNGHPPSYY